MSRRRRPELAELTDDPEVAPGAILSRQPQDQLAHLAVERRPAGTAVRVRPVSGQELPMPAQKGLRSHHERSPRVTRQYPTDRSEEQPITRGELRPPHLTSQGSTARVATPGSPAPLSAHHALATRPARTDGRRGRTPTLRPTTTSKRQFGGRRCGGYPDLSPNPASTRPSFVHLTGSPDPQRGCCGPSSPRRRAPLASAHRSRSGSPASSRFGRFVSGWPANSLR
jgi:hypothetical protein